MAKLIPLNIQMFAASGSVSCSVLSQDINNNTSNVRITFTVTRTSGSTWWGDLKTATINCDGQSKTASINLPQSVTSNSCSADFTISHNSDGTKTIAFSASVYPASSIGTISASGSQTLPTIARNFSSSPTLTLVSKTETTAIFNWTTSENCDQVQYKIGNGNWINVSGTGRSGSYTITGLNPNTSYTIYGDYKRSDSQQWSTWGGYNVNVGLTTYDYPYCSNTPNFTIGNQLTISLYNPLKRNVAVTFIAANGTTKSVGNTTGTSISGFNNEEWKEFLYNSIPNVTNGKYQIRIVYGSSTKTRNNGNTYTINANESKPIFEDFDYSTNLSELTGNNDTIINGKTTTTFTISIDNKAIAQNGATMQRYYFECGSKNVLANYSDNVVTASLNGCTSDIIKVIAIDSRGLETSVSKIVSNFKTYFEPVFASTNIEREDGIEETAYLDAKINFWNFNFGIRRNLINYLKYRVRQKGTENWSNWFSINVSKLVIDKEEATLENELVYLDGISQGFVVGNVYEIQLQVTDGTANYNLSVVESGIFELTDGQVAFSIFRDNNGEYHIGLNGMPDENHTLKIHGDIDYS